MYGFSCSDGGEGANVILAYAHNSQLNVIHCDDGAYRKYFQNKCIANIEVNLIYDAQYAPTVCSDSVFI